MASKILAGRYELLEKRGDGGMAVVYKAKDRLLNRFVAIKILKPEFIRDPKFVDSFRRESQAAAGLSHPNVVSVFDVGKEGNIYYIVMEMMEGDTLSDVIRREAPLSEKRVIEITRQIAAGLSAAHKKNIIHRDVKPHNVIFSDDGVAKITDFGIAKAVNNGTIVNTNTTVLGSVHYLSPEQARGECLDARSDVYSLGVVMYEMLTGHKPYEGDTIGEIAVKHMNADPEPPHELVPDIPPELERITLKAMSAPIDERYQSANELLADLDAFTQAQLKAEETENEEQEENFENPAVVPIRSVSEMDKERYAVRHRRAQSVSFLTGVFGAIVLSILLFAFLWDFWLGEIFSPAERISLPNFIGSNYQAVVENADLAAMYSFNVVYVVDTNTESGTILGQDPSPGRSMMVTPEGIRVELTVSTGTVFTAVPDVVNIDYREAKNRLQQAGFQVEIENATSNSVTKDYVISTSPAANDQLSAGSTVYVTVSSGPEIGHVEMPNLVGLTEDAAISKLESLGLSYGGSDRVSSDLEAGTVIGQSVNAFTEVEEHSKIQLKVSSGPDNYR